MAGPGADGYELPLRRRGLANGIPAPAKDGAVPQHLAGVAGPSLTEASSTRPLIPVRRIPAHYVRNPVLQTYGVNHLHVVSSPLRENPFTQGPAIGSTRFGHNRAPLPPMVVVVLSQSAKTLSKGVPSMSNFAVWSPSAACFVQGVLCCLVMFAAGGLAVLIGLTTQNVMATIVVFCVSLIAGLTTAHGIVPVSESSPEDEETHRTAGAMGFCCTFFLGPVAVLVSVYLVLAYLSQK